VKKIERIHEEYRKAMNDFATADIQRAMPHLPRPARLAEMSQMISFLVDRFTNIHDKLELIFQESSQALDESSIETVDHLRCHLIEGLLSTKHVDKLHQVKDLLSDFPDENTAARIDTASKPSDEMISKARIQVRSLFQSKDTTTSEKGDEPSKY
jgi:hypothetical protein